MSEMKQLKTLFDLAVKDEVQRVLEKMVKAISDKYGHERQEIYDTLEPWHNYGDGDSKIDLASDSLINQFKCIGKTKYGTQCSRSRQGESMFCGSHLQKLSFGRIDDSGGQSTLTPSQTTIIQAD